MLLLRPYSRSLAVGVSALLRCGQAVIRWARP